MSKRVGNIVIISEEKKQQCDLCGKIAELRPYGPNGECICYECGMKDEKTTSGEACKALNITELQLKNFVSECKLREFKDGSRTMYKVDQVEKIARDSGHTSLDNGFYSLEKVMAILNISKKQVKQLLDEGKIQIFSGNMYGSEEVNNIAQERHNDEHLKNVQGALNLILVQYQVGEHLASLIKPGTFKTHNGDLKIESVTTVQLNQGNGHHGVTEVALKIDGKTYKLSLAAIDVY